MRCPFGLIAFMGKFLVASQSVFWRAVKAVTAESFTTPVTLEFSFCSTGRIGVSLSALSAVRDVTFAKDRAISRLFEMRTEEFLRSRPRCGILVHALANI